MGNSALAAANRISGPVDYARVQAVKGNVHRLARPEFDRGPADPAVSLNRVMLLFKPSAAQQADLNQLLAAQRNPSSPNFHKWLTPDQFADRFGVSTSDQSKVVAWLQARGLAVKESARGRNWIAFSGATAQISLALGTEFHRYQVNGQMHIANATSPLVPEAFADVVNGFVGLDDFKPRSMVRKYFPVGTQPGFTTGTSHYLVPQDWETIYDVLPLYEAGLNGTGQSIAIVGQTDIDLQDIEQFRAKYNLIANDPTVILYGEDPGTNAGDQVEADLDLEWSGAIAPYASVYYVNSQNAFISAIIAVDGNVAPILSISYGSCEVDVPVSFYEPVAQQANAQGMTILNSAGDSGAAGCDDLDDYPYYATLGEVTTFPANLPEVTGVGGTQFNDANGNYWSSTNASDFGSALGYIPEVAWNETTVLQGIAAGAGGVSQLVPKPAWQTGPGVPNDGARDVPDMSMDAAIHDPYYIIYGGSLFAVGGTSAASPSFAGLVALLNEYEVSKGFQTQPGLGNINPRLYQLARSAPSAFHDITSGNNIVPCAQNTLDCMTGSYGYSTGAGYDPVTGLGSVDANNLVTQWNTSTDPVTVTLNVTPTSPTVNQNVQLTATVTPVDGGGTPTGIVNFEAEDTGLSLGSAALASVGGLPTATVTFAASMLGPGEGFIDAVYPGDSTYSSGSTSHRLRISTPVNASAVLLGVAPNPVYAAPPDAQGLSWQATVSLLEVAGVPSMLTGFTIDGQAQSLAQYFPSTSIPANGTLSASVILRNLATPKTSTFAFTGVDSYGNTWTRQTQVTFLGTQVYPNFNLSATPLTMTGGNGTSACQYSQLLTLDETGGFQFQITDLTLGNVDMGNRIAAIFGTTILGSYASLRGTLCWNGITPPATDIVTITLVDTYGDVDQAELNVSFAAPPAAPTTLSATPVSLSVQQGTAKLSVGVADSTQSWTASVFPTNRTTAWLQLSQYSGTGPAQITLTASATGLEPGVYRANIVLQSANASPQMLTVPVMFVNGPAGGTSLSGVTNAESFQTVAAPGMIMAVFGTALSNSAVAASTQPLPYTLAGVSATVNGVAAPLYFVSPGQLNIQVPFETGAGPAVIGVNNNGQIAGLQFEISPSAPAILTDGHGNVNPSATARPGAEAVLYETGDGPLSPALPDGFSPASGTAVSALPMPLLPFSVTVGGAPAFLDFVGVVPGVIGLTQVNFVVPSSIAAGAQPVVVTVNGVASPPATITVQGAAASYRPDANRE